LLRLLLEDNAWK